MKVGIHMNLKLGFPIRKLDVTNKNEVDHKNSQYFLIITENNESDNQVR
jgi:hypothetical protein